MVFGLTPTDFIPFYIEHGTQGSGRFALVMMGGTLLTLVAMAFLLLAGKRPIGVGAVLRAAVVGVCIPMLVIESLRRSMFLSLFALLQLYFDVFCFAFVPLALAALARRPIRERLTMPARAMLIASLAIWPAAAYAFLIEPFRLQTERHTLEIADRPLDLPELRIGVLSDLQTDRITDYERHVIDSLLAEKPDLILIPGDLFQGDDVDFDGAVAEYNTLLSRLEAPLGVYFVTGDVDPKRYVSRLLAGTRIRNLDNQSIEIDFQGRKIDLCGITIDNGQRPDAERVAKRFMEQPVPGRLRLAFAHHPDDVNLFGRAPGLDLFVSGHTHGGQIVLPFLGPLVTLSNLPKSIGAGGLHRYIVRNIYVSRGAGMERSHAPRIRFLCPPEIAILTVKSARREP